MNDLELDALAFRWRGALDTAADSLGQVERSRRVLHFSPAELRAWVSEVERERGITDVDLERLARATHTHLHRHMQGPRATGMLLGLGSSVEACVFDLDGVLTPSAALHAAAWRETFDEFLSRHHAQAGGHYGSWRPFEVRDDYFRYIHGRPRIDGARGFLASRGIRLPAGTPDDLPSAETEWGLAARKNEVLQRQLRQHGVSAYEGSIRFLELAREAQLGVGDRLGQREHARDPRTRRAAAPRRPGRRRQRHAGSSGCARSLRPTRCWLRAGGSACGRGGCDVRHDGRGNRGGPKRRSRPSGRRQPRPLVCADGRRRGLRARRPDCS